MIILFGENGKTRWMYVVAMSSLSPNWLDKNSSDCTTCSGGPFYS